MLTKQKKLSNQTNKKLIAIHQSTKQHSLTTTKRKTKPKTKTKNENENENKHEKKPTQHNKTQQNKKK
jgi:hypothetical protein